MVSRDRYQAGSENIYLSTINLPVENEKASNAPLHLMKAGRALSQLGTAIKKAEESNG